MAEPSWQELLRLRLAERNNAESAFAPIIEQCELILRDHHFLPMYLTLPKTADLLNKQSFSKRETLLFCAL